VLPSDGHLRNQVRDALGASARVIAAAAVLAERARELGVPDGRVDTVHNGIHDQAFGGTETERQSVVLFVGSLSETKDPLAALRIFSAFTRKSPEARFVLYGEGPMASRVREEAGRLGLRGRVELRGRRPHEEVLAAMKHARVLLNSSRSEGRCNSVLEALASGTPVVAPELPSFHELVSDLEGCLLYPGGDVERGGARLLEAWRGEPDRARISSLVRPYTWAAFGEKVGGSSRRPSATAETYPSSTSSSRSSSSATTSRRSVPPRSFRSADGGRPVPGFLSARSSSSSTRPARSSRAATTLFPNVRRMPA
jgi:glycosyltransferase involved in cell wall biosynthesis